MSRKDRRRVSFSPDVTDQPASDFLKRSVSIRDRSHRKVTGMWSFRLPRDSKCYSPVEFLRGLKTKVAKAIGGASKRRSSGKVSSSASLSRSWSVSDPIDCHRVEALEDCIEFLNSSASLKRTSSVSYSNS